MKKILLLVLIAAFAMVGYISWDKSFTDTISEKDIEQVTYNLEARGYGCEDLKIVNLYDKHDHAKYLYAYTDQAYIILFKSNYTFIEGGEGRRYSDYLSGEYKLYYFAPMGCYAGPADLSFKEAQAQGLLHDIHQEGMDKLTF